MEKYCWVYAIKSKSTGKVYIGITSDIDQRLRQHNLGLTHTTKKGRPWVLIARELLNDRSEAMWTERELKRSRGRRLRWLSQNAVA